MRHQRRQRPTILCIDDHASSLSLRQNILERSGYRVLTADSGTTALELAKTNRVDLALVDYEMPQMDGFAIAALLRCTQSTMRIVMVSGHESKAPRGFHELDGFILKAIPVPKFLRRVEQYVGR